MNVQYCNTPAGCLELAEQDGALMSVRLVREVMPEKDDAVPLLGQAADQLREYFAGQRKTFDLPLAPQGTAFQKAVWKALLEIPYGQTCTYGDIARRIGNPRAARAVGMANHYNPLMIVVPCHRVVGSGGALTGYACGLDVKKFLLELEKAHV